MENYYFLFYVGLIFVILLAPELTHYKKIRSLPNWKDAVRDMLANKSEIMFMQHFPELRIFSLSYYDFRRFIRREDFNQAMEKLYEWALKRYPYRVLNMVVGMVYLLGWLLIFWAASKQGLEINKGRELIEAIGAFLQISGILQIYFFIIRPFMKSSRFVKGKSSLEVRATENYFPLKLYITLLLTGIISYFFMGIMFPGVHFSAAVSLAFVHILTLYLFARRVIDKGAPFDSTTKFGSITNRALLHTVLVEMIRASMMIIVIHLYMEFFLGKALNLETDLFNLFSLLYIMISLGVIWIRSYSSLRKKTAEVTNYLKENTVDIEPVTE